MSTERGDDSTTATGGPRRRRWALLIGVPVAAAAVAGFAVGMGKQGTDPTANAVATGADTQAESSASPSPSGSAPSTPKSPVTMSATGDILIGSVPNMMPANDGQGFFDDVTGALASDLQMGNLEQALTDETDSSKCGPAGNGNECYQFRLPPQYATLLSQAGFKVINQANNHAYDFGPQGYANTKATLQANGITQLGDPGTYAVLDVKGTKVAVIGFSSYDTNNNVNNIPADVELVKKAQKEADIVVVQAHMGAEGSDQTHTPYGSEIFYDENRGDVRAFSHAMIDAGADVVIGHSPHVLRGMEFYNGHLIAYSLGNFTGGGGTLSSAGALGLGGILKVTLNPDGTWAGGQFVSTQMDGAGRPTLDSGQNSLALLRDVSVDYPGTAAVFGDDGTISAPTATPADAASATVTPAAG